MFTKYSSSFMLDLVTGTHHLHSFLFKFSLCSPRFIASSVSLGIDSYKEFLDLIEVFRILMISN